MNLLTKQRLTALENQLMVAGHEGEVGEGIVGEFGTSECPWHAGGHTPLPTLSKQNRGPAPFTQHRRPRREGPRPGLLISAARSLGGH